LNLSILPGWAYAGRQAQRLTEDTTAEKVSPCVSFYISRYEFRVADSDEERNHIEADFLSVVPLLADQLDVAFPRNLVKVETDNLSLKSCLTYCGVVPTGLSTSMSLINVVAMNKDALRKFYIFTKVEDVPTL